MQEITIGGIPTNSTVVANIRNSDNTLIYNKSLLIFEVYSASNFNTGQYDILMYEQGGSGYYVGDFPDAITPATYNVRISTRLGNNPYTYTTQTNTIIVWSGGIDGGSPVGIGWISRNEYKLWAGICDSSEDAKIDQSITQASALCSKYLQKQVKLGPVVEYFTGSRGQQYLALSTTPVVSVDSVTLEYDNTDSQELPASNFFVNDVGTLRFRRDSTSYGYFSASLIKVAYTAGYTEVPADLKLACMLVMQSLGYITDGEQLVSQKTVKDVTIKFNALLMADATNPVMGNAKAILDEHRDSAFLVI